MPPTARPTPRATRPPTVKAQVRISVKQLRVSGELDKKIVEKILEAQVIRDLTRCFAWGASLPSGGEELSAVFRIGHDGRVAEIEELRSLLLLRERGAPRGVP